MDCIPDKSTVPALKWAMVFVGTFLLALSISFLRTDNKYIGFFGEYQRRTGYLSYFCLTVFFVASSFIFRLNNIIRLEVVALVTGFLTALYGVNQHFNHDFIHWNKQVGDFSHAVSKLQSVIKVDKRNYDAYQLLAQIYEYQKNWILAIGVRKHIASMDPFNQVNLLQLGEDEKNNGNTIEAYKIIDKISSFAPNSSEASQAIKDFSN